MNKSELFEAALDEALLEAQLIERYSMLKRDYAQRGDPWPLEMCGHYSSAAVASRERANVIWKLLQRV